MLGGDERNLLTCKQDFGQELTVSIEVRDVTTATPRPLVAKLCHMPKLHQGSSPWVAEFTQSG